jgi:phosphoenolpyruvate carboxykinase (GTP)
MSDKDMAELLAVDPEQWKRELPAIHEHFAMFGDHLPSELREQLQQLEDRIGRA